MMKMIGEGGCREERLKTLPRERDDEYLGDEDANLR
ncbi:hypothetical protein SLEP1_g34691 [Rubroshorea leprosula]|uniref:Uncharacterized protein n=1 Tax=Rubroshorea leprosula TaxID=152421 RepID=A0AAV5KKT1_9ROSI|nr:hypothetical protein SLEP1_g34691 [Rubroshorea leprosula]